MAGWRQRIGDMIAGRKSSSLELFKEIYGARVSKSGASVTVDTALGVATVFAICRVICNGIAQVPWQVYQDNGATRRRAVDHPLYKLLSRRPNSWQTSFEFRETIALHLVLASNAYVFINRVGIARDIRELIPIDPSRVRVERRQDMSLDYFVRGDNGLEERYGADAIWHLRGPSWNGWSGMEAVKLARDAIGLSITLEQSQAEFQKNGAQMSGALTVSNKLSPERYDLLAKWLDKHLPGGDRFGKPLLLDDGAKYLQMAMTAIDQQLLESRKMQVEEICRAFGVMPIMVGYSDKAATYASAEQMFLAHVVHTLAPWYERIEQSADIHLFSDADQDAGFYAKFNPNGLMRGAAKDRAEFYKAALGTTQQPGWMVRNEVRALEELDPVEGGNVFPELITTTPPAQSDTGDTNA